MRTTVELSEDTYRRLKTAAVERGVRGFSPIVEDALEQYFRTGPGAARRAAAISAAEGAWSGIDVAEWERERDRAWATWPATRS